MIGKFQRVGRKNKSVWRQMVLVGRYRRIIGYVRQMFLQMEDVSEKRIGETYINVWENL